MRRVFLLCGAALVLVAALNGCASKKTAEETSTSSDSLLASNPVEQPQGSLTPQTQYQQQQTSEPPPMEQPTAEKPRATSTKTHSRPSPSSPSREPAETGVTLAAGTPIQVGVTAQLSTETANVGDTWTGEVKDNVIVGNTVVVPAGSQVNGVIAAVAPAQKGSRASLELAVKSITVNGKSHPVSASMEPIVAGSTRARNVGAVAGGAAAGALIGKAVGGSGKGALIGGLIGGASAAGAAAASKGYQVVLKEGTVITFSVKENVMVRS
ncbi:MAG: hypothetical protein E6K73_09315 [Candidatus Eisenbacteria bacterium]|uniref:Glycine zipper 2TM domain-containing protein n=1 Tax=Eiseniibacteriota bacterium TaxID=2212470 RepID=A0A538SEM9_UNCEI|nr:MAG: hypothetical protein E6K73_09315 [Candidatus Eisenbacteria bacterium]